MGVWYLIQGHSVLLDSLGIFALFKINITHIHPKPACVAEHFVSDNHLVRVDRLLVHLIGMVLVGQIEQNLPEKITIVFIMVQDTFQTD